MLVPCFYGLSLTNGASLTWPSFLSTLVTTFTISWTIFSVVTAGLAIVYRVDMLSNHKRDKRFSFSLFGTLTMVGLFLGLVFAPMALQQCCDIQFSMDIGYLTGSLFVGGLISTAIIFRVAYRSGLQRIDELEKATLESRYETLKAQMQPHFLFNSLNSLSELIDSNMPEASEMTARLADLYRHILENSKEKTSSLASELAIIRNYLELERLRFGNRLHFTVTCRGNGESVFIPSLILQTLVENAVKHGISTSISGGTIEVNADVTLGGWTFIQVRNTGSAPKIGNDGSPLIQRNSTKTGLANAQERLTLMYQDVHGFNFGVDDKGMTVVEFRVPGVKID